MTIYFVANSVMDFDTLFGDPVHAQDQDTAGAAPGGIRLMDAYYQTDQSALFRTLDTVVTGPVWMSFILDNEAYDAGGEDYALSIPPEYGLISFWDGEGNNIFTCGFNTQTGNMEARIQLRDGTTADVVLAPNTSYTRGAKYDFKIEPGIGLRMYINRELIHDYSGNVGNFLSTTNGVGRVGIGNGDAHTNIDYSRILVADFDTRYAEVKVVTLNTLASTDTSSGGESTLTPRFMDAYYRSDYIANNTLLFDADGEKIIYPENDTITIAPGHRIEGVVMSWAGVRTEASPVPNTRPVLKIGATEHPGPAKALGTATTHLQDVVYTNPATLAAWTANDLEGLGYGLSLNV